jgi:hypothetical protein
MNKEINGTGESIHSPDERLRIFNYRITQGGFGQISAEGAIQNAGNEALKIEIKADYYDASGIHIGSEVETIKRLNPGYSTAFDVAYCSKNRYLVRDVKLSVEVHTFGDLKPGQEK